MNRAATVVVSKTPPLRASPPTSGPSGLPIPLGRGPTTPPTPLTALVRKDTVPAYKLNREIHTIPALWRLWTVGVGGALSVEELDRRHSSGWRQTPSERQYYSMRKTLIDEIKERVRMAGDSDSGRVVREMEEKRTSTKPSLSLDKVIKALKAAKKAG
jgi:hypothetical protein